MNDAPRKWWNRIDGTIRKLGRVPTRADRCCYVGYDESDKQVFANMTMDEFEKIRGALEVLGFSVSKREDQN
eukprot:5860324-Amphidinium_carterae.1